MNTTQTTLAQSLTNLRYHLCGPHAFDPNEFVIERRLLATLLQEGIELQFRKGNVAVPVEIDGQRQLCTQLLIHSHTNPDLQVSDIELLYFNGQRRHAGLGHGLLIRQDGCILYQRQPNTDPQYDAETITFTSLIKPAPLSA